MASYPFQKICCIQGPDGGQSLILAASGPIISSFDLHDGTLLSQWPREDVDDEIPSTEDTPNGQIQHPSKRRRLSTNLGGDVVRNDSDDSVEIVSERKKGERRKSKLVESKLPNVSHLVATSDAATVVAVTAEDKSINVFRLLPGGNLSLQSKRAMPKRLCAIVLTPDEKSILAGDKFGDVYLLPLHPTDRYLNPRKKQEALATTFAPSASELTVHTKGNREALKQQQEQKHHPPRKEGPDFEHKLILGHVSLLTDVVIVEVQLDTHRRQYILSADRDEHIRVSRGITQAHIIEAYCPGHIDFVSKLCIPPWQPELLVSGGGEPSLKVYNWQNGRLIDQEFFQDSLRQDILSVLPTTGDERLHDQIAVAGIWPIHYNLSEGAPSSSGPPRLLAVSLEGLPLLLSYTLTEEGTLRHHQTLRLSGNILDLATGPALWQIIVSIDNVHFPGSVKNVRPTETATVPLFETYQLMPVKDGGAEKGEQGNVQPVVLWEITSLGTLMTKAAAESERIQTPPEVATKGKGVYSTLGESIYGLENLRKKKELMPPGAEDDSLLGESTVDIKGEAGF